MKTWDELTPNERKVEIAEDVLQSIKNQEFTNIDTGHYVDNIYILYSNYQSQEIISKEQCKQIKKECSMCARGALLIGRIDRFNTLKWNDVYDSQVSTTNGLKGSFTQKELELIECACEQYAGFHKQDAEVALRAEKFGDKFNDPVDRMIAICENIIENNGEFVV